MDWNYIKDAIVEAVINAGGFVTVFLLIAKFFGNKIVDAICHRCELNRQKELEKAKTLYDKKEYISKARFDKEFQIYQELSEKNINMVYSAGEAVIITRGGFETEEEIQQFKQKLCDQINDAEIANKRYAPFISKDIFEQYKALEKEVSEIFALVKAWNMYRTSEEAFNYTTHGVKYHNIEEVVKAIEEKQKIVSKHSDDILDVLRDYLNRLDVIE